MTPLHRLKLAAQAVHDEIDTITCEECKVCVSPAFKELRAALAAMPVSEDMTQAEIDEMVGKPGAMADEGWISVKDRMPLNDGGTNPKAYLTFPHFAVFPFLHGEWVDEYDEMTGLPIKPDWNVTYWRPLPEPPQAGHTIANAPSQDKP